MRDKETAAASRLHPYGWWKEQSRRNGDGKDPGAGKDGNMELGPRFSCTLHAVSPQNFHVET